MTLGSQLEAGEHGEKGNLKIPLTNGKKNEAETGKNLIFKRKTFFIHAKNFFLLFFQIGIFSK